jgi:hypothetical protein
MLAAWLHLAPLATTLLAIEGDWETTSESEQALERGLDWLARNQGNDGDWGSQDLGLIAHGTLAFLADGHMPGRGKYGVVVQRGLDRLIEQARPSGLINVGPAKRDMHNHGLSTFVLGQAFGMSPDQRLGPVLDRALRLIVDTQCDDGGWQFEAQRRAKGNDLSITAIQIVALRGAADCGLEVPPEVAAAAGRFVREHYRPETRLRGLLDEQAMKKLPGEFANTGGDDSKPAIAAAGVLSLYELEQYDDWRIAKNMDVIARAVNDLKRVKPDGKPPLDVYASYFLAQAIYQTGGRHWRELYPPLRDALVESQRRSDDRSRDGSWIDNKRFNGREGELFATSVACYVLAIPNHYLPALHDRPAVTAAELSPPTELRAP